MLIIVPHITFYTKATVSVHIIFQILRKSTTDTVPAVDKDQNNLRSVKPCAKTMTFLSRDCANFALNILKKEKVQKFKNT